MNKPQINNTFKDEATGLTFVIPASHQLSPAEATAIISHWLEQEKARLFAAWKAQAANNEWEGDEVAKREELFNGRFIQRSSASEILLTWVTTEAEK